MQDQRRGGDSGAIGGDPSDSAEPGREPIASIGVFDSGLGGLTVMRSLIDLVPGVDFTYFGDTGRFPYGTKPPADVRRYALEIGERLAERGAQMVVVACNSASAVALDDLRSHLSLPVVGVIEPGVRAARAATHTGRIGVIGTVGTVRSGAYQRVASQIDPGLEVTCAACPGFVEFVESGDVESDQVHVLAERLLAPLRNAKVDTLVLGCTHYPLLARTIGDVMGNDVVLVSSADETAFEVRALLTGRAPRFADAEAGALHFATSGDVSTFRRLASRFLGPEVVAVEQWAW
jgi:glutamate racemase